LDDARSVAELEEVELAARAQMIAPPADLDILTDMITKLFDPHTNRRRRHASPLSAATILLPVVAFCVGCGGKVVEGDDVDGGAKDAAVVAHDSREPVDTGVIVRDSGIVTDTSDFPPPDPDACSSCANTRCSKEIAACSADDVCKTIVGCINACPSADDVCKNACVKDDEPFVDLIDCIEKSCAAECSG
jgi:hypothetical protein